jgi:DNA polymerase theta
LEIVAIRLATSRDSLDDYIGRTMLSYSADPDMVRDNVETSIRDLKTMGFITVDDSAHFQATQLGKAVVASSLDPEHGNFVHGEFQKAMQAFVMDGDMHVLYTFTPVHDIGGANINWRVFWNEMEQLDDSGLRVMKFLGLKPTVVTMM